MPDRPLIENASPYDSCFSGCLKSSLISTQSDCLPSFIAGKLRVIFCISDDRASNGGKLHTDLVMTSGVQMNLKFGLVTFLICKTETSTEEELPVNN